MNILTKYKLLFVNNRFLRFGFFLTVLHVSSGGLGYIYQVLMGRELQPAEFALFSSLMAFFMFLAAPTGAMSMLIVRRLSLLRAHNELNLVQSVFFYINKCLCFASLLILFLFWIGESNLKHYLKIESVVTYFLYVLIIVCSIFYIACMAFLQGLQHLIFLGAFGLSGVLIKILISVGLINIGFGVNGALLGVLLSMLIVLIFAIPVLLKSLPKQTINLNPQLSFDLINKGIPVLIANTVFTAMTQLDMVLVNWLFTPDVSGLYAAASVLGKAVLYLPGGLILALFPMVSENHAKGKNSQAIFLQAVIVTISTCTLISGLYWFCGGSIINFLYGEKYKGAELILQWYGVAILPFAILIITEQYLLARGKVLFVWIFLFIFLLELLAVYIWHSDEMIILLIMGLSGTVLAIIGCSIIWRTQRSTTTKF